VLAVVTAGVYLGWYTPELTSVETRLTGAGFWAIFNFLLNALLFGLVGLQLQPILDGLSGHSSAQLVAYAAAVSGVVIATRLAWIFPLSYLPRMLFRSIRERDPTRRGSGRCLSAGQECAAR
jgi:NhaP-type Na+/H+ and K+/H+ antiporters